MSIEEWVKQSREDIRQKFGTVGVKEDCGNHVPGKGCMICQQHNTGRKVLQQCEMGVCYFYSPKE